jgi:UDP-2,3-diacylglucosamine hydrolase
MRAFFFSDLHVRATEEPRTARLLRVFEALRGEADAVFLVGDVFDFWLGWRDVVPGGYLPVLGALARLAESGTRVVVFAGNHDPDPGPFFADIGVETCARGMFADLDGCRVWMEHGDLVDPRGFPEQTMCRLAHDPRLLAVARALPYGLSWRLATAYAERSETRSYDDPLPQAMLTEYLPARAREGADVVVVGHFHRAVRHRTTVDGRPVALFGLGDWLGQRTYLRFADGRFALLRDRGDGAAPVELPEGDHAP